MRYVRYRTQLVSETQDEMSILCGEPAKMLLLLNSPSHLRSRYRPRPVRSPAAIRCWFLGQRKTRCIQPHRWLSSRVVVCIAPCCARYRSYRNRRELKRSASRDQLDDQYDYGHNQQKVDEAAGHVETETQNPENQKYYKDSPKHARSPYANRRRQGLVCSTAASLHWMQIIGAARTGRAFLPSWVF